MGSYCTYKHTLSCACVSLQEAEGELSAQRAALQQAQVSRHKGRDGGASAEADRLLQSAEQRLADKQSLMEASVYQTVHWFPQSGPWVQKAPYHLQLRQYYTTIIH